MSPTILTLVLASAVLHVAWNALAKPCRDTLSLAWLTTLISTAVLVPPFVYCRLACPGPLGPEIWLWAGVSGLLQCGYVIVLFTAYSVADLSVVYPVSRGLGPLLVMFLAGRLVGDSVTPLQTGAVCLVAVGTAAVGLTSQGGHGRFSPAGMLLALATAAGTAGYSLADRKAMSLPQTPGALEYLFVCYLFLSLFMTAFVLVRRPGWSGLLSEWRRSPGTVAWVGLLTPASYLCVVAALGMGNVVLVTAGRNVGILLSTAAGAFLLGERVGPGRLAGAATVFVGLVVLALARTAGP